MKLAVYKHPAPADMAVCVSYADSEVDPPSGAEWMTVEQFELWKSAQVLAGWVQSVSEEKKTDDEIWKEKLAGRIDVNGISLAASEEVRNILTGQFSMVVGAVLLQVMPADTPQEIFDADGKLHTMPASSLIQLLFSYGQQWTGMHKEFAP